MTINVQNIAASSQMFGFRNYTSGTASVSIPSQVIASGKAVVGSGTISLENVDAVSSVKIRYTTVETFWRQAQGYTTTGLVGVGYALQSNVYYSGGNLVIDTYAINDTAGSITLPAQTIDIQARLFRSPFAS